MKMIILALSICTWQVVLVVGQKTCESPAVPNGHPVGKLKQFYNSGETLSLICDSTHKFDGTRYALCDDGSWILPACKPLDGKCAAPSVLNAKPQGEISAPYPAGSTVRFLCDHGFEFEGTQYALCDDGTWRLPACKPIRCESRPRIEHGDVTELSDAHELQVQCVIFHKLVGPETVRCVNKKWTELPVCKPPCVIEETGEYLMEGERKKLSCGSPKKKFVTCVNGGLEYGECRIIWPWE